MLPKINITYNKFLDPVFIFYCQNNPDLVRLGWNKWTPISLEQTKNKIEILKKEWASVEGIILTSICEVLGLTFYRNVLDVYIVSGNPRQFSTPLVMKVGFKPDEFIDNLSHELIHVLLSDNYEFKGLLPDPEHQFPKYMNETQSVKNHIIVHAVLKYLYLDVHHDPSRLDLNIASARRHSTNDYARAWEIVESDGYLELINDFKSIYKTAS